MVFSYAIVTALSSKSASATPASPTIVVSTTRGSSVWGLLLWFKMTEKAAALSPAVIFSIACALSALDISFSAWAGCIAARVFFLSSGSMASVATFLSWGGKATRAADLSAGFSVAVDKAGMHAWVVFLWPF